MSCIDDDDDDEEEKLIHLKILKMYLCYDFI